MSIACRYYSSMGSEIHFVFVDVNSRSNDSLSNVRTKARLDSTVSLVELVAIIAKPCNFSFTSAASHSILRLTAETPKTKTRIVADARLNYCNAAACTFHGRRVLTKFPRAANHFVINLTRVVDRSPRASVGRALLSFTVHVVGCRSDNESAATSAL